MLRLRLPISDEGVVHAFIAKGGHRPMARNKSYIVSERKQFLPNRANKILVISFREVGATNRLLKKHIANQSQTRWFMVKQT